MSKGLLSIFIVMIFGLNTFAQDTVSIRSVTNEQVFQAADFIGLEFTGPESELLFPRMANSRKNMAAIRGVSIPYTTSPAYHFDPKPIGFKIKKQFLDPVWSVLPNTAQKTNEREFAYYSILQLSQMIRSRQITSVELTKYYLGRLKKYDSKIKCVITLTEDLALQQAKIADQEIDSGTYRGMLHGIPYGAKDLLAVKDYPTSWGVSIYKDRELQHNATVIQKLEDAGAVLVAKLSLGELAMGDVWYEGVTRNPWNIKQGSSGSSAGSAAAVSAGLLPFAIGSETYGSIVSPSYRCGVTGLRPTFGRVSRAGAMTLSWTLDKIGPICTTVEDCAIVFDAIQGSDPLDSSTVDAPFNYNPKIELNGLRVGYYASKMENNYENKKRDLETIKALQQLGVSMVPIEEPGLPINPLIMILNVESAASFDELTRSNQDDQLVQQDHDDWANIFRSARFIPAVEYINANRIRSLLIEQMNDIMKQVDVIVAPPFHGNNLLLTNLTGHPCIAVPNGFNAEGGLTAITFIGHLYDEARLLAVAKAYQDATAFHLKHPKLD